LNLGALYNCEDEKEKAIEWYRKYYQGHRMVKSIIKRMQQNGQIVF